MCSEEAKPHRHAVLGVEDPFPVKKSFDLPQEQLQLVTQDGAKLDRSRNQLTELKRFFRQSYPDLVQKRVTLTGCENEIQS